ncbi:hypothetical protein JCM3765_004120 [Sporobolomyces pararoseus]
MELFMTYLPHSIKDPELIESLSSVLHRPPISNSSAAPVNFSVHVFTNRNKRNGKLSTNANITIGDAETGQRFLDSYGSPRTGLRVRNSQTRTFLSKRPVDPLRLAAVRANPFVSPESEIHRISELQRLREPITLARIEFGRINKREPSRFKYQSRRSQRSELYLRELLSFFLSIILRLINDHEARRRIAQTTTTPLAYPLILVPFFEGLGLGGDQTPNRRVSALDEQHALIAQFCSMQILLTFPSHAQFEEFRHRRSDNLRLPKVKSSKLVVQKLGRYSRINELRSSLAYLSIPVAFQVEMLLHSETFDVSQLLALVSTLRQLEIAHGPLVTERILHQLGNRQTDRRTESWRYDETGEDWFDEYELDGARPFESSTFKKKDRRASASLSSSDLKTELIQLATRAQPLLESSLFSRARKDLFLCRHVILTPSRIVLEGPFPDDSNSIIRRFPSHSQHFIRVSIRDEDGSMLSYSRDTDIASFLRERFPRFFKTDGGLEIAGRQFDLLGYSQSALREHSTWFVAPFTFERKTVTAATIRTSLGDFSGVINIPARYMARLAQAFTTTQPSLLLEDHQIVEIDDVTSSSGSCFTDGVGKISPALAADVDRILTAARPSKRRKEKSTCYQFRLGGAKGMLAIDPTLSGKVVHLRPSQVKFEGSSFELDIADTFGRPLPCYLNRPLIKILEDLGIPVSTFQALQDEAVARIHKATTSLSDAGNLLERTGLGGPAKLPSLFANLASVLKLKSEELDPFLKHCEGLAVAEALKSLKFKARIPLPTCVTLVGVADEDGWLEEGEIYACVKRIDQDPFYLKGEVCISRSPSIHPGDVQVVKAVGKIPKGFAPRTRNLVNCVVFSVKGDRSLPSCLGGGDLDGDIYQLITLPELIPERSNLATPAAYYPPRMNRLDRPATIDDGVDFFLGYITSDLMGQVASRHLQLSDYYPEGTRHRDCIALAQMHSDAVDYPKTGTPVSHRSLPKSPSALKPQFMCGEYWAHQKRKEGKFYYTSDKALGVLFRAIPLKDVTANPSHELESELLDPSSTITNAIIATFKRLNVPCPPLHLSEVDQALAAEFRDHLYEFCEEFSFYATINSLSSRPDRYLSEAEVLLGYLSTPAKNPRLRQDKAARLQKQTDELFEWLRGEWIGFLEYDEDDDKITREELPERLYRCWIAWLVATNEARDGEVNEDDYFGVKSFGFVVLQMFLDLLKKLDELL